jgi:putative SOS response-associated peptidase YedK
MKYRRCLIPADGFYEWQAKGSGAKQPFYIHARSGEPLAFAGLWETWTGPNGEEVETAAIVTTRANGTLAPLHDRMPVIVPPEAFDLWLDCTNVDARTAEALIAPAPDDQFEFWPVSTMVNRTANDNPALMQRGAAEPPTTPVRRAPVRLTVKPRPADDGQGVLF